MGTASSARQDLIKSCIRLIIENIVPERIRILFKILETGSSISFEKYSELFHYPPEHAKLIIQQPEYNEYDRMHFLCGVQPEIMKSVKVLNDKVKIYKHRFQTLIHTLIRTRNRILRVQAQYNSEDSPQQYGLTGENIVKFLNYMKQYEMDKNYQAFKAWNIPTRKLSKFGQDMLPDEDSLEMTDSDTE